MIERPIGRTFWHEISIYYKLCGADKLQLTHQSLRGEVDRSNSMRKLLGIYTATKSHWVGDGFPVRQIFSHATGGMCFSPFLLLDYAGPADFLPARNARGVGTHPHRGFETVTIVYKGEVEHRDSAGNGGIIGPGDVQWMTAAAGILHKEHHSEEFTRSGGTLEMVQLWVNLPAQDKSANPGYQTLLNQDIPSVRLSKGAGSLRVIAGDYEGQRGPAHTFTPINVWDMRLNGGSLSWLTVPEGHTTLVVVLKGSVQVNGDGVAGEAQLVLLDHTGGPITVEANTDSTLLILSGAPIDEPVVMKGPFVMNTTDEIGQAMVDFQNGRFGDLRVE
jgi:redox-sensitive bicupin YhaK (pirin superfamily)